MFQSRQAQNEHSHQVFALGLQVLSQLGNRTKLLLPSDGKVGGGIDGLDNNSNRLSVHVLGLDCPINA